MATVAKRTPNRPLIPVADAAAILGISESQAYRWIAADQLAGAVRVANRWYVRRRVLEAWLDGQDPPAPPSIAVVDGERPPLRALT